MNKETMVNKLCSGNFDFILKTLYGESAVERQRNRYISAIEKFSEIFPERDDIKIYSAPGRTEIGGNHTDHQHGCVLAAAVDLDVIAVVAFHNEGVIRLKSAGHSPIRTNVI